MVRIFKEKVPFRGPMTRIAVFLDLYWGSRVYGNYQGVVCKDIYRGFKV